MLFNNLNRLLDLVFISNSIYFSIYKAAFPVSTSDMHHVPLLIELKAYSFLPSNAISNKQANFNFKSCDFTTLNSIISDVNWDSELNVLNVESAFKFFKSNLIHIYKKTSLAKSSLPTKYHGIRII